MLSLFRLRHQLTEDHRVYLQKEKQELTVRSTLLWNIPMRGDAVRTRTLSQGSM